MIGRTVSHYKIIEKLGEGGMGAVYLAEDTSLGRKVAIKFLSDDKAADPESRKRFVHEARAQALVSHTNVASFYEVGEEGDKVFIVMEYIEGQKLSELAKAEKPSLPEILDLAIQIGEGLTAAHEKGVMHRDINPANILVTSKRMPKITDFGLAKWKGASTITRTGLQMGTDAYMSPEQVEGRKPDFRTDIFSLGAVLYELICARRPFEGTNRESLFYEILYTQPQPLARFCRGVPESLERLVMKCLAKKPEERYQSAADLVADLRRERKNLEYAQSSDLMPASGPAQPKKKVLKFLVPTSAIAILAILFFIFNPFKLEVSRKQIAEAAENSLAVMYFDNVADPEDKEKTAQMITSLLITDLSESEYMSVVSQQRLYDILKLLGKEDLKVINRQVASEVAEKAGAKWILTGKIMQAKPTLVVTAEVSEPKEGKILASQKVTGASGEDLFAVVDKLSAEVKKDLSLPLRASQEPEKPVAEVTTHSPEAYRYYLEGLDYSDKLYWPDAEKSFRKAIELDSTFAMAYYQLADCLDWQTKPEVKTAIVRAVKYSNKVSRMEKHYIKSLEARLGGNFSQAIKELEQIAADYPQEKDAFFNLGLVYSIQLRQPEKAVGALTKAIEIDPLYKLAYNMLAYAYNDIGNFEKSLWAINKYISLAPEEANPYDTRGDLYAHNGKLDLAVDAYKKTLEVKPDWYETLDKLGNMYLFKGDYVRAESCYRELSSSGNKKWISQERYRLACIPLYQGKFERALALLDQGIAADEMEGAEEWTARKHQAKSAIYHVVKKNLKMALAEIEKTVESYHRVNPNDLLYFRPLYIQLLAEAGEFAKAEKIARAMKKDIEEKDTTQMFNYWSAFGWIEWAKGNRQAARASLERVLKALPQFATRVFIAHAYLEAGWVEEAVAELEKMLSRYDESRARTPYGAKIYYALGLAYEKSGWNQKAMEKYQEFLEIWKNADPGIAEVDDAKQRLARLKRKV